MFAVVYIFKIRPNQENEFIKAWSELTKLIYEYEGSWGSRLHRQKDQHYIAYAQWPNKKRWENSGKNLPENAKSISQQMHESCENIETLFELDMIEDLLKK